jgi:hypothetical protein
VVVEEIMASKTKPAPKLDPNEAARVAALAKAVTKARADLASDSLPDGCEVEVDFAAHIKGSIKKGRGSIKTYPAAACPWKLLAVALDKLAGASVASIVREAQGLTDTDIAALKERTAAAMAEIAAPTTRATRGAIRTSLQVTIESE